jgi:hypothetical protein
MHVPRFDFLSRLSFTTGADGERLFIRGGPWSRPYVIPDEGTERILRSRHRWLTAFVYIFVIGQFFLFSRHLHEIMSRGTWLAGYLAALLLAIAVIERAALGAELRKCERAESRLPLAGYFGNHARQSSTTMLRFGTLASMAFVASGIWMLLAGEDALIALPSIGFFSFTAFCWGYALVLKKRN